MKRIFRMGACAGALLLLACGGSERMQRADGDLVVEKTGLEFPDTTVGGLTSATLTLHQTGRIPREVSLEIEGEGFEVPPAVSVPAGVPGELKIAFRPSARGMATAWLHLYSNSQDIVVTLYGNGTDAHVAPSAAVGDGK